MEALRTTIAAERLATVIDLPESLRHQELEVIVLPQTEEKKSKKPAGERKSMMGCLKEYANPDLWEQEEGAWERAAAENYLQKKKDGRI